jgi:hypothetical protein
MGWPDREPSREHVLPRRLWNSWQPEDKASFGIYNNAIVCRHCNISKKGYTLVEWYKRLVDGLDPRAEHVAKFMEDLRHRAPEPIAYRILNGRRPPRVPRLSDGIGEAISA